LNLSNTIDRAALYFPDKTALVHDRDRFSYGDLKTAVDRVAFHLRERGVRRRERVAIYMPNRPEWVAAYYGIIRLGAVAVCVGAAYKSREIEHLLKESGSERIITCDELLPQVPERDAVPGLSDVIVWENEAGLESVFSPASATPPGHFAPVDCALDDEGVILFTGGTTGTPKGAMLTHRNILFTAQNVCYHEGAAPEDVALCFLPLHHVFGGNHIMNSLFYGCGTLVLHKSFDMDRMLASVQAEKITRLYSVPTVFIRLLNAAESRKYLGSVRYCFSAAASMASEIVRRWRERFDLVIHEAYGMTETASLVTFNHQYRHKIGSVGTPAGVVEVKIVDAAGGGVPAGESGEILIRGPNVMKGYFNKSEETEKALRGGWLRSGDIGRLDEEGYLFIVDRIKDLIISGGLNVYPSEVEEVLYTHPAVEECAVVGVPHPEYGESVSAFIKIKPGLACAESDLIAFCKQSIAAYKAPKKISFVAELPKSPAGKILKREVRQTMTRER
jgi:long-chain acyl-CoA synthetase